MLQYISRASSSWSSGEWSENALSPPRASEPLELLVALRQRNVPKLTALVRNVSDPTHAQYGQYLSAAALGDLVRPTEAGTAAVLRWLHAAGASSVTVVATADFVRATIAAANASRLWSVAATPRCAPLCTPRSRLRYTTGGGFSRTFQQPA
tara:strand:+ start:163 stop:618 length:456 start_codon:yes stop_codon:yes gene_type:complete